MKKLNLFIALFVVSLITHAQGYNDMFYNPSDDKEVESYDIPDSDIEVESSNVEEPVQLSDRDIDEYNRRYQTSSYQGDSVKKKSVRVADTAANPDEGWVNGFNGSQSDYEYSKRLIRYNSPNLSIHISSPYYWDIVYGLSSYDWNVYVDGNYAYAFPTFSNPMWWDWRFFRPTYGYYYGWYSPYCYYPGWYVGGYPYYYWDHWYYPHYHHYPHYATSKPVYRNNYRTGSRYGNYQTINRNNRQTTTTRRTGVSSNRFGNSFSNRNSVTRRSSSSSFDNTSNYNYNERRTSSYNNNFDSPSSINRRSSSSSFSPSRSGGFTPRSTSTSRSGGGYSSSSRSGGRR